MLAGIQDFSQTQAPVSGPLAKAPDPSAEQFSVVLDKATLTVLLDEMNKLGLDTRGLHISNNQSQPSSSTNGRAQPLLAASAPPPSPLALFEPPPSPVVAQAATPGTASVSSEATFVPEFQQNLQVVSSYGGSSSLNPLYFATRETADWIAKKYGTGEVVELPYAGTGGPYSADATEFYIKLPNGRLVNAGLLADYYRRMPEAQFPGMADRIISSSLG
jgi:hypothetical protein